MRRISLIAIAGAVAVFALLATGVSAQNLNEETFITFGSPVELPGVVLPADTYVFKVANPLTASNVVQVFRKSDNKVMGQWFFASAKRVRPVDKTLIMFKEEPEGATPAIQYWFYPNRLFGKEFIYPKKQAQTLAARYNTNVLTEAGRVNPSGQTVPEPAPAPAAAPVTTARNAPAPPPVANQDNTPSEVVALGVIEQPSTLPRRLPRTASPFPFIELAGLISLALALGVRRLALARQA